MAVRIKLKLECKLSGKIIETAALVNSAFESIRPELIVPRKLAEELGIWPCPPGSQEKEYGMVEGTARMWSVPGALRVSVVAPGAESPEVDADVAISTRGEVLISDKLAGALGIVIFDLAEGIWKLRTDPPDEERRSVPPRYW